jgi:hypothetical protein
MVERDASEFERLQELGDILGLTPMEVASVRGDLAEQGFRRQVEEVRDINPSKHLRGWFHQVEMAYGIVHVPPSHK